MDDGIDEGGQAFQPGNWNQCSDKIEAAVERFNDAVNQQVESEQQVYLSNFFVTTSLPYENMPCVPFPI